MPHRGETEDPASGSASRSDRAADRARGPAGSDGHARGGERHGGTAARSSQSGRTGGDLAPVFRRTSGSRGDTSAGSHPRIGCTQRAAERARETPYRTGKAEDRAVSERPMDPDVAELADLPHDDPRVTGASPRVRAQLRAYRDFVAPGTIPEGANVNEAEDRLARALEREIGASLTDVGDDRVVPPAPRREGFWTTLLGPRLRPVWAAAALIVVVGIVWFVRSGPRTGEPVMRGAPAPAAGELATA